MRRRSWPGLSLEAAHDRGGKLFAAFSGQVLIPGDKIVWHPMRHFAGAIGRRHGLARSLYKLLGAARRTGHGLDGEDRYAETLRNFAGSRT